MHEYSSRKRTQGRQDPESGTAASSGAQTDDVPNSALQAVLRGSAAPDSNMMGHRENLAQSVEAKMSRAFGMDLSQLKLYRTDAMSGSGMEGLSSGNKIVLSKDIDLNTLQGQAVLGHEISHLHAQSFGLGMGHTGLYENASLEKQADTEGALAARGMRIDGSTSGMALGNGMASVSSLSPLGSGLSASAGAPMQAKKNKKKGSKTQEDSSLKAVRNKVAQAGFSSDAVVNPSYGDKASASGNGDYTFNAFTQDASSQNNDPTLKNELKNMTADMGQQYLGGTYVGRVMTELSNKKATGLDHDQTKDLAQNLISTDPAAQKAAKLQLREIRYRQLEGFEKKYGRMFEQMDPLTLMDYTGTDTYADLFSGASFQDVFKEKSDKISESNPETVTFGDERDERYRQLEGYYSDVQTMITGMGQFDADQNTDLTKYIKEKQTGLAGKAEKNGASVINGPMLTPKQMDTYKKYQKKNKFHQ